MASWPVTVCLLIALLVAEAALGAARRHYLAYATLLASEARFSAYIEHSPQAVIVIDAGGHFVECNPAASSILGLPSAALAGQHFISVLDVRHREAGLREFAAAADGMPRETEFRICRPDGRSLIVHLRAVRMGADRYIAFAQDITERKRAERQMRIMATAVEHAQEGIVITDPAGVIIAVNPAFTRIAGYTIEESVGQNVNILRSGRHDAAFWREVWRRIQSGDAWQGEVWNRCRDGSISPQWLTISTVRDAEGRILSHVGMLTDNSRLRQSETRLAHLVHHDALTGLPNRLMLHSLLEHALTRARHDRRRGALLTLDLDRFETVNSSLGHQAGDALLIAVAERLRAELDETDTLARLGGDEFAVLIDDINETSDAAGVAQKLLACLEQAHELPGGFQIFIGASIGIACFSAPGQDAAAVFRQAGSALHQAKQSLPGSYRFYTEALTRQAHDRLDMEARMRRALEAGEFVLHYQPLVSLPDHRIVGAEALLRWRDGEHHIAPGDFIPLAEETGLIVPLGEFVLRRACRQLRDWQARGVPIQRLSVNLSPVQFLRPDLPERIGAMLDEFGIDGSALELEITEGTLLNITEESVARLERLKSLGLQLAIDDFGIGYSSLAYLKRLPIDMLKIDRSFVRDIPEDPADAEIATAIIAMARALNLKVVAEGIETAAQRDFLAQQGCHFGQGFLFGRGLPPEQLERRLRVGSILAPDLV